MAEFIYYLHWVICLGILGTNIFLKRPSIFHPHVIFTFIVAVFFFSDFLVRKYDDSNCIILTIDTFNIYQLYLLPLYITGVAFSFYYSKNKEIKISCISDFNSFAASKRRKILIVALIIFGADIYKRLLYSDFSVSKAVVNSFLPYGLSPWNSSKHFLGDEKFVFNLVRTALPLAGVFFSILAQESKYLFFRVIYFFCLILVILMLLGEGSRTPLVGTLFFSGIIYYYKTKSYLKKVFILTVGVLSISFLTSLAHNFRAYGLYDVFIRNKYRAVEKKTSTITYHQDDNYYQLVRVLNYSDIGVPHWDGLTFFTVIVVNPIPRFFWPGKPFILQDYYGKYKEEYITISYIGEFVAIFGNIIGITLAILVLMGIAIFLNKLTSLLYKSTGLIIFFIFTLYVYMIFRSFLNVSQFIYLPIMAYLAGIFINTNFRLKSSVSLTTSLTN